jgi:hypothetical protein
MKKSIMFFSIIATLFLTTSCQQDTAVPELKVEAKKIIEVQYLGPRNTEELKVVLASSKDEVISSLDVSTKESLIKNMIFSDGLFRGMKDKDDNIQKLYDTNFGKVLSSLLQVDAVVSNHPVKNNIRAVFGSRYGNVGGKKYPKLLTSDYCSNCKADVDVFLTGSGSNSSACCIVGGSGCSDYRPSGGDSAY